MPSLPEVIEFAKAESLGLVVEIKERFRVERLISAWRNCSRRAAPATTPS